MPLDLQAEHKAILKGGNYRIFSAECFFWFIFCPLLFWVRAIWEMIAATVRLPWVAPTVLVGPRHLEGDRSYCAPPLGSALFLFV